MKIQLKSDEDLTIVTKGGGNVIVPNNTDTSADKTLATVDQIGPVGGDKANAASLAAPYESDHSSAYVVGDYVTHEGTLYKCKSDTSSPPGEWDDNNWDPVAVTDEMGEGGTPKNVWFGTCSNSNTRNFSVTTTTGDFSYQHGNIVVVRFANAMGDYGNDATLSVDGGAGKYIKVQYNNSPSNKFWSWPAVIAFVFDTSDNKQYFRPISWQKATTISYGITLLNSTVSDDETTAATPKAVNTRVNKSGDTMTGALTISPDVPQGGTIVLSSVFGVTTVVVQSDDGSIVGIGAGDGQLPSIATVRFGGTDRTAIIPDNDGTIALQASIAPAFSDSETYAVGDYVSHEGLLYKCATAVETAGSWTGDTNWAEVTVTDEMGGGVGDRIVSQNERTEVVANQDGTASIIDNEGQKGLNIPEGFSFSGISFEESGLVAFSGPYKLNGAPSNAWFWLPPGVDPSTWEYGTNTPAHIFLGGTSESEPVAVLHNGFMPLYAISGWNTDNPTLTRSQSAPYLPEDITVAMVPLEKTVATVDQMPTDTVSHQELDDALFNKVSQNAQFRMSIKDDGKVVVSGCRYRSANSTIQPFLNTYCVVSSETSLFDGGGGKIDFKIFNSTNDELLYRAVGYVTGNWTVLQNNLTSEAASYLPNVGGNIQFPIIITTNPENKVLEVYLTGSGVTLHPWSNFTSWADSKTKTLATLQNIAADFSMDSTYAVGDYVTHDGSLWKCKVAVTTAGQWTGSDNWEEFIVTNEMATIGYVDSKIGDINSVLDAINGEEI